MSEAELHSSIRPNPKLSEYLSGRCKYYYLPLHARSFFPVRLGEMLGAHQPRDRNLEELRSSFVKAEKGIFSHVKVPLDRPGSELLEQARALSAERKLPLVFQVPASMLAEQPLREYLLQLGRENEVEVLLDGPISAACLREIAAHFRGLHCSVLVHPELDWRDLPLAPLSELGWPVHLYFPYQLGIDRRFLSCVESHRVFHQICQAFPKNKFLPPRGVDLHDARVQPHLELEPDIAPCFATNSANPQIFYSVVIPTYNNQNHLRVTINHLLEQDVGPDAFELIIVDDGSTDQTQGLVLALMQSQAVKYNFKYIYFPRAARRSMGDAQFRAGIARNLGVKNAVGEVLCFLDSDIVTPPNYLREIGKTLPQWGALQARRIDLTQAASHLGCRYEAIVEGRDTEKGETYWDSFTRRTRDWHLLPYNWKYVCTHSFSLRRDLFWALGGFKRNFIFYGFEDTDLGYRITKSGKALHLLDVKVYHLFHEPTRSEFMNLSSLRQILLGRTAQIFYLHHLDNDIFENLRGYMSPEQGFRRFLLGFANLLTLGFLRKPASPLTASLRELRKAGHP